VGHGDLSFHVPDGWRDTTQVTLVGTSADGAPAAEVVVSREAGGGASLKAHADRLRTKLRAEGVLVHHIAAAEVGGRAAIALRLRRSDAGAEMEGTLVLVRAEDPQGDLTLFRLTTTPAAAATARALFDDFLASVRFETDGPLGFS
jgi:hypothetical protein